MNEKTGSKQQSEFTKTLAKF